MISNAKTGVTSSLYP